MKLMCVVVLATAVAIVLSEAGHFSDMAQTSEREQVKKRGMNILAMSTSSNNATLNSATNITAEILKNIPQEMYKEQGPSLAQTQFK